MLWWRGWCVFVSLESFTWRGVGPPAGPSKQGRCQVGINPATLPHHAVEATMQATPTSTGPTRVHLSQAMTLLEELIQEEAGDKREGLLRPKDQDNLGLDELRTHVQAPGNPHVSSSGLEQLVLAWYVMMV